jgi:6-phosphogluconate dehydrogenase
MRIGMVGLGRMGANMVRRLMRGGHECVAFDRSAEAVRAVAAEGARAAYSLAELVKALEPPRAVWIMVPAALVDSVIAELRPLLARGDILIDGGNSHYQDDIRRAEELRTAGLHYVDAGTSGGVLGLEQGYCLMIGAEAAVFDTLEPIFATLSPGGRVEQRSSPARGSAAAQSQTHGPAANDHARSMAEMGYLHCGPNGAGHFVKMVHNGIEYAVMAAYAEGLNLLRHANAGSQREEADAETAPLSNPRLYQYELDMAAVAEVWRHGSIISSRLLDLTAEALAVDPVLGRFGGRVSDSGEGRWTVQAAVDVGVPAHVLAAALFSRFESRGRAEFADKLLSAMRLGFGGHLEKKPQPGTVEGEGRPNGGSR